MPSKPKDPMGIHVLSLAYEGSLASVLRLIADQIEHGSATAEEFTVRVGRDVFELVAKIHLNK